MILIQEWGQMLFLACPIMKELNNLIWCGLFVNDLSMHDYSRDIMLASSQEQIEMKMALANTEGRTKQLAIQLKKIEDLTEKNQMMKYHLVPKAITDKLVTGASTVDSCEYFQSVSILFSGRFS